MLWPKKIHTRNLITKKNSCGSKIPLPPITFLMVRPLSYRASLDNTFICHIAPLLQQLYWLPIRLRIEFKILLITFKVFQGSAPKYLIDLISVLPPSRYDLRRNNKGILLSIPKRFTKVTMGDRSFMAAAPRLWNSLPISIRSACTKSDFKQKLKTFLFSKAFC